MQKPILEMNVETVRELMSLLSVVSPDMPVSDSVGELLCVRVFERDGEKVMEVA